VKTKHYWHPRVFGTHCVTLPPDAQKAQLEEIDAIQTDAYRAGMTRAAEIADNEQLADMAEGNFATQAVIVDAILKARDAITTLDGK